ncbi:MAG TPA: redoxin family protein [Patescibacteria group bacterium]|nr:redoxin family protein [Patescibacteria group bacterium]
MSNNNYVQNSRKSIIVIVLAAALVLFAGWALFKTSGNPPAAGSPPAGDLNSLVGKPLPALQLSDKDGKPYSLASLKGKNVVLFFNEGIMCYPACWNQVVQLGLDQRFNGGDTAAFSVVIDQPGQWQQAIAKMPDLAKAILLFDQGGGSSRSLGLLDVASSMHKGAYPGHTYIVLDKQGIVRFVYDDPTMAINNDMLAQKIAGFNQ